jgi:hypothetical protein
VSIQQGIDPYPENRLETEGKAFKNIARKLRMLPYHILKASINKGYGRLHRLAVYPFTLYIILNVPATAGQTQFQEGLQFQSKKD